MAFFEWKEEYSGGIESIDDQHKVMISLMNELYDSIVREKGERNTKNIFIELLKYANYHFGLENQLFAKYDYQEKAEHLEQHQHFIDKIRNLMLKNYLTEKKVEIETLHYLRLWFQDHMLKIDMEYCKFFRLKEVLAEVEEYLVASS